MLGRADGATCGTMTQTGSEHGDARSSCVFACQVLMSCVSALLDEYNLAQSNVGLLGAPFPGVCLRWGAARGRTGGAAICIKVILALHVARADRAAQGPVELARAFYWLQTGLKVLVYMKVSAVWVTSKIISRKKKMQHGRQHLGEWPAQNALHRQLHAPSGMHRQLHAQTPLHTV